MRRPREAGRQLQHPEENLEHALAVSAAADMIQNVVVDWTFTKFMDFRKILNSRWNVFRTTAQDNSAVGVILKQNGKKTLEQRRGAANKFKLISLSFLLCSGID